MPLETGSTIEDLVPENPIPEDPVSEGDNHLRLIKFVLQQQFPGSAGQGFNTAILATETELNYLQGAASNIQDQIDAITGGSNNLPAPAGTILIFGDTPPVGWTKLVSVTDAMLRVVSDNSGNQTGGSISPISMSVQHSHSTGGHALDTDEMPTHNHFAFADDDSNIDLEQVFVGANFYASSNYDQGTTGANSYRMKGSTLVPTLGVTSSNGSGNAHTHGPTSTHVQVLEPKYYNVYRGIKD